MDAVLSTSFEFTMGMIFSLTIAYLGKFGNLPSFNLQNLN